MRGLGQCNSLGDISLSKFYIWKVRPSRQLLILRRCRPNHITMMGLLDTVLNGEIGFKPDLLRSNSQELKSSSRILFAMVMFTCLCCIEASDTSLSAKVAERMLTFALIGVTWIGYRAMHDVRFFGVDLLSSIPGLCYRRLFLCPPDLGYYPIFAKVMLEVLREPENVRSGLVVTTWCNKLHVAYPGPGDPGGPIGPIRKGATGQDPEFIHLVGPPHNWLLPKTYLDRPVGGYLTFGNLFLFVGFCLNIGPVIRWMAAQFCIVFPWLQPGKCYMFLFADGRDLGMYPTMREIRLELKTAPMRCAPLRYRRHGAIIHISPYGSDYVGSPRWDALSNDFQVGAGSVVDMVLDCLYSVVDYLFSFCALPAFRVFTFGTRGDVTPMKYYVRLLNKAGVMCDQHDCLTPVEGLQALKHVEQFEFYKSSRYLTSLIGPLHDWIKKDNCVAIAPLGGVGHLRDVVTFDLAPPPSQLLQFRLLSSEKQFGKLFNWLVTGITAVNCPDIRVGSFDGCAPRSCDGLNLLTKRPNAGKRKYLIAMGSSSHAEPYLADVDILDVWSTRPNSVYQYDDRTNHAEMMADYEHVVCHGGAGTMATAASCGCLVTSADRFLDRDYVSDPDFTFQHNHFWFWYGLMKPLSVPQRLCLMFKVCLLDISVVMAVTMYQFTELSRFGFVLYVFFDWLWSMLPDLLASRTVPEAITVVIASGFKIDLSLYWRIVIIVSVAYCYRKLRARDLPSAVCKGITLFFYGIWQISTSTTWSFVLGCCGPVVTVPLVLLYDLMRRYWWADMLHYLTMGLIDSVDPWCDHDDRIMMRFSSLEHSWLPFVHVDFTDGQYYTGVGVTLKDGFPRCRSYVRTYAKTKTLFSIPTALTKDRWDELVKKVMSFDGVAYTGLRNCQTAAFSIRSEQKYGGDIVVLGFIAGASIVAVLALVVPLSILALLGVTCLAGPTIFALGGPDAVPTWQDVLSLAFIPSLEVSNEAVEMYKVANETNVDGYLKPKNVQPVCKPDVEMSCFDNLAKLCCFITHEDDRVEAESRFQHVYHISDVPNLISSGNRMPAHDHEYLVLGFKPSWYIVDLMLSYPATNGCLTYSMKGCRSTWGSIILKRGSGTGAVDVCFTVDNSELFACVCAVHRPVKVVMLTCSPQPVPFKTLYWQEPGALGLTKALSLGMPLEPWAVVSQKSDGCCYYGDKPIDLTPLVSQMYGCGNTRTALSQMLYFNRDAFLARLIKLASSLEVLLLSGVASLSDCKTIAEIERILEIFSYGKRSRKGAWAPVQQHLRSNRVLELDTVIHENPRFVDVDYDKTLGHYLENLSLFGKRDVNVNQFCRRVNRNPHVDLLLKARGLEAGGVDGIDGIVLACKEIMINSLASYTYSRTADALLDDDIVAVSETIINQCPELYLDARVADPKKLVSHFMKHKNFSAGLPFVGFDKPLRKRSELRTERWLRPIAQMALLPFQTGEWYPSLAHAFPKSQVVPKAKLLTKPSKLRSVVATSLIVNVQQGVLNFDINNRHAPHDAAGKCGLTLNGAALGAVFSEASRYKYIHSLDAESFDRNLNGNAFAIVGEMRKAGYRNHPCRAAIEKHIDMSMKQEQIGHIVNLISDLWRDVERDATTSADLWQFIEGFAAEYSDVTDEVAVKHTTAPGGVVTKRGGGTTGSSNTSWQNTHGYDGIIVYSVSKAQNWPIREFFERIFLANMSDDNIVATDEEIDWPAVYEIAERVFGCKLRVESTGSDVFSQTFLGKYPKPGAEFTNDFALAGLPVPEFAVLHEKSKLLMRYSNYKADATRKMATKTKECEYRIQKSIGYLNLCAHQPDLYKMISSDLMNMLSHTTEHQRNYLLRKHKIPSYVKVVQDWYKLGSLEDKGMVKELQFTISSFARTEQVILRTLRMIRSAERFVPLHLLAIDGEDVLDRVVNFKSYGLFESHIFHCFVRLHGVPPDEDEMAYCCKMSPYSSLTNVREWYRTVGRFLPVSGKQFERNTNYAVLHFWLYTAVYCYMQPLIETIQFVPAGSIVLEMLNIYLFTSRSLFGTWNYAYYGSRAQSSMHMSSLVPKDPYRHHKLSAYQLVEPVRLPQLLSLLPIWVVNDMIAGALDFSAGFLDKTLFMNRTTTLTGSPNYAKDTPQGWIDTASEIADHLANGKSVICSAHTGTGKTRYIPSLLVQMTNKPTCIAMPRRILCEQYAMYPGVVWWQSGPFPNARLVVCTYGFLSAKMGNGPCVVPDVTFVLDESHETACEMKMLFDTLFMTQQCVLLTATPKAWMHDKKWPYIQAKIPPLHDIVDRRPDSFTSRKLDDVIVEALRAGFKRILVIHPHTRAVKALAVKYKDNGFYALHSGSREIPETGHVVATAIADAGLTLPGCDLVIDTGLRVVNDQGRTLTKEIDKATSLQRRGRTGRTNPGEYWLLGPIVDIDYVPSPDVACVLAGGPMAKHFKTRVTLMEAETLVVPGDKYGRCKPIHDQRLRTSHAFYSKLLHLNRYDESKAQKIYTSVLNGNCKDDNALEFLLGSCEVIKLAPIAMVLHEWNDNPVLYVETMSSDDTDFALSDMTVCQTELAIRNNVLGFD